MQYHHHNRLQQHRQTGTNLRSSFGVAAADSFSSPAPVRTAVVPQVPLWYPQVWRRSDETTASQLVPPANTHTHVQLHVHPCKSPTTRLSCSLLFLRMLTFPPTSPCAHRKLFATQLSLDYKRVRVHSFRRTSYATFVWERVSPQLLQASTGAGRHRSTGAFKLKTYCEKQRPRGLQCRDVR